MFIIRIIVFTVFFGSVAAFAALNNDSVTVHYLIGKQTMPLCVALAMAMALGVLLGSLLSLPKLLKLIFERMMMRMKLKKLAKA